MSTWTQDAHDYGERPAGIEGPRTLVLLLRLDGDVNRTPRVPRGQRDAVAPLLVSATLHAIVVSAIVTLVEPAALLDRARPQPQSPVDQPVEQLVFLAPAAPSMGSEWRWRR